MSATTFTYDDDGHVYTMTRKGYSTRLPSVTEIVNDVLPQWRPQDPWYMERGTEIHRAALMLANDKTPVNPQLQGHIDGLVSFLERESPVVLSAEFQVYHPRLIYAGTFDLVATLAHYGLCIVDYKCSGDQRATALQLAAYTADGLVTPIEQRPRRGVMVTLPGDGTYKLKVFDLRQWWPRWAAVLSVYNIKRVAI